MVTTGNEDAWQRQAYVSIESSSTVKMQYEALMETIDFDNGERGFDMITLLNLGQIPKHGPMGIFTLTFEGYPLQAGTADTSGATRGTPKGGLAKGFWELFSNAGHADTAQALDLEMTNTLTRYRVAILLTDQAILEETALSSSNSGSGSITVDGTPLTTDSYNGAIIKITSGTANGGYYMVTDTSTSAFTTTSGDTPSTDGVADNDSFEVTPTGSSATLAASNAKRFVIADCTCVSCKTTFTDGILKQTLIFKGVAFDKSEAKLVKSESNDGNTQLPALGDYTAGTTRWA